MKTNKDFRLRELADVYMLVSTGEAAKKYPGAIHLSETARFIWERVDTMSREEIAEAMITEFEIDLPTAQRDVTVFIDQCIKNGLIEE